MIEYLEWDTEFFGIKIGRVFINNEDDFNTKVIKSQLLDEKYSLVYFIKLGYILQSSIVQEIGLDMMDIIVTMSKPFEKMQNKTFAFELKNELNKKELYECYEIAATIASVSRFYREPKIGTNLTKALYRKWIDNAVNSQFADGLLIVKENESVAGIHIIKTDNKNKIGNCSVIGVGTKYKRKGYGYCLWNQAFGYWANNSEIRLCQVPFSLQNISSMNFHMSLGFNKVEEIKYVYHYRNYNL